MFEIFADSVQTIVSKSGFLNLTGGQALMILVSFVLMYLAIRKGFEPLLLLPIAFGMLLTNLPMAGMYHPEIFINDTGHIAWEMLANGGGLLDYLYLGVKLGIYPPLIFLGIGCMTDFGPLIANPKSFLHGRGRPARHLPRLLRRAGARLSLPPEAGSIGIIGGADGPTAIFTTTQLAPHLLGSMAIAAYSYMALVPIIQPPIMKLLTTKKERAVRMEQLRPVSKLEKIVFPILVAILVLLPRSRRRPADRHAHARQPVAGSRGVVDRLDKTAQNELMNIITIFLGVTVGATADARSASSPRRPSASSSSASSRSRSAPRAACCSAS